MAMSSLLCLDMTTEYDQVYFPSQDSHRNPMPIIEHSNFQIFHGFQEGCHEFYDPITKWLNQSYSEIYITINSFWHFLVPAK